MSDPQVLLLHLLGAARAWRDSLIQGTSTASETSCERLREAIRYVESELSQQSAQSH